MNENVTGTDNVPELVSDLRKMLESKNEGCCTFPKPLSKQFTGIAIVLYKDGNIHKITDYVEGKKHGNELFLRPSGQVYTITTYNHGFVVDDWLASYSIDSEEPLCNVNGLTAWYESGQIQYIEPHLNYEPHGRSLEYYESGQLKIIRNFEYGALNGRLLEWLENGKVKHYYSYNDWMKHGVCFDWHQGGMLKSLYTYSYDVLNGAYCRWLDDGTIEDSGFYQNGKRVDNLSDCIRDNSMLDFQRNPTLLSNSDT